MKLYSDKRAPNPRRVRMFLAEKNITGIELVDVDIGSGENRSPDYLAKNPLGWLPLLELDDGTRIAESVAICRYFEALQPTPALFGTSPETIGKVEQWNRHAEIELLIPISETFRNGHSYWTGRIEQAPAFAAISKKHALSRFDWLDKELASRTWIAGESFTIADITAVVAVDFGRLSDIRIGETRPNLARWYAAMRERPSYKA